MHRQIINCFFSDRKIINRHYHLEYELIYVMKGKISLNLNDHKITLKEEDFYLIHTGCPHYWYSSDKVLIVNLLISFDAISEYFANTPTLFACHSAEMSTDSIITLKKILYKIFTYSYQNDKMGRIPYDMACLQLLYFLSSSCIAPSSDSIWNLPQKDSDRRAFELLKYISENYTTDLTLGGLAERFHLSPPYLSRYFKEHFGLTFVEYLRQIRLEHAVQELVSCNKSISMLSMEHGFPNASSFIKSFKNVYQLTPTEYRQKHRTKKNSAVPQTQEVDSSYSEDLSDQIKNYLQNYLTDEKTGQLSLNETIKVNAAPTEDLSFCQLKKPWKRLLNMGNSINFLRYDIREQLRFFREELQFDYVYLNNLLHPSMKISLNKETGNYNFSEIRKALDYIVSLGMHPYIELESQEISTPPESGQGLLTAKIQSCLRILYQNHLFLDSFLNFLVKRYGQEELSHWYFCLERSSAVKNMVDEEDYFKYFSSIYSTLKSHIPGVKVGGPGFTIDFSEKRLESFIQKWLAKNCIPDFISVYVFPYVYDLERIQKEQNLISPDRDFLSNVLLRLNRVMQRTGLIEKEIHVTIWNSTLSSHNILNDSPYKAAYIIKNMMNNWKNCDFIGYWCASDICIYNEEDQKPLFGGSGLLSQNSLKKTAYHAYTFLNHLLPYCISQSNHAIITTNNLGRFAICCHNYKHFNALFYQKREESIQIEEFPLLFEDQDSLHLTISLNHLPAGKYLIRKRQVNENSGNIQASWVSLNQISDLVQEEMDYLRAQSEPGFLYRHEIVHNEALVIEENLRPHEVVLFEIDYAYE